MSEKGLWNIIRGQLASGPGKWMRVENPVMPGTPDIHYCVGGIAGWIELKEIPEWPVKPTTAVRIDHFTKEQRLWIYDYANAGGRAFVLLRVNKPKKCYLLFGSTFAYEELGTTVQDRMRTCALVCDGPTFPRTKILRELLWEPWWRSG